MQIKHSIKIFVELRQKRLLSSFAMEQNFKISSHHGISDVQVLEPDIVNQQLKSCIPPLTYNLYKGQAGRIGVVGGCEEYTGAPYYAAISSLKVGADLSFVFCMAEAATVIKTYSPELIVHPVLSSDSVKNVTPLLKPLHALVIGPGLGRSSRVATAKEIISKAKDLEIPLVFDADGIHLISEDLSIIEGYKNCILTPNLPEFKLLYSRRFLSTLNDQKPLSDHVLALCQHLGNVTILLKHQYDIISDGLNILRSKEVGSPRRCGGQGDVVAGACGTFFHWTINFNKENNVSTSFLAAFGASMLTKRSSSLAFAQKGRSTTTVDIIDNIGSAFSQLFD